MKAIISLILRKISRKYLQYFAGTILKLLAPLYWGNNYTCPIENRSYRKFLPYGRINPRPNALCPGSLSLERHRLLWLFLKAKTNFFSDNLRVLHIAPELCFMKEFEKMANLDYVTADLESPLAKVKMDIHEVPFEDNTFDVIFCNHVMEHVQDDIKAMNELRRVMKPTGWAVIQVPFFYPLKEQTFEDPEITGAKDREKAFGQDDHVRMYGKDYPERLREAGFTVREDNFVKSLSAKDIQRFVLPPDEVIYYCTK